MNLTMFERGMLDFVRQNFHGETNLLIDQLEQRASAPVEGDAGYDEFMAGWDAAYEDYITFNFPQK